MSRRTYFGGVVLFSVLSVYFLGHIIYWYMNDTYTDDLIVSIKDEEVVGVPVDAVATPEKVLAQQFPFIDVDFTALKKRNAETVAWLKVGAVGLDIPIVQTTDNEYYLNHDIDGNLSQLGWVFADTRSQMEHMGTNTVLYGHNSATKQMFGSLKNIFDVDAEKKAEVEIIQMNTPDRQMVYEIVSVYETVYDDWQYVAQIFEGDEDKQAFVDRMREMNSIELFDRDDLKKEDSYLTFSTCHGPRGTTKRLVIHARLIAEK